MAFKGREIIVQTITMIANEAVSRGACLEISSSEAGETDSDEATYGVALEDADDGALVRIAVGPGNIVKCLAHDSSITEGEWVTPEDDGRVDGIGGLTGGTQYPLGIALQASSAQDQLIPVLMMPHVSTKAET